jgi:hypothetical protein
MAEHGLVPGQGYDDLFDSGVNDSDASDDDSDEMGDDIPWDSDEAGWK